MGITLPDLPYAKDALEPHISSKTMEFHYGKHHNAYVEKTKDLIKGTEFETEELNVIIKKAAAEPKLQTLFNNAAQVWNHSFFWQGMKPGGGGKPTGKVAELIDRDLGGYEQFVTDFKSAGMGQFGSGWAWLILQGTDLAITKTPNAENMTRSGLTPLLTVDVWEHAYYLDYQNRRADFLQAFIDHLINWDFVNENLKKVSS